MTTEFSVLSEPDDEGRWRYIVACGRWTYSEAEAERLAGKLAALHADGEPARHAARLIGAMEFLESCQIRREQMDGHFVASPGVPTELSQPLQSAANYLESLPALVERLRGELNELKQFHADVMEKTREMLDRQATAFREDNERLRCAAIADAERGGA
jgi:hypothetical protein